MDTLQFCTALYTQQSGHAQLQVWRSQPPSGVPGHLHFWDLAFPDVQLHERLEPQGQLPEGSDPLSFPQLGCPLSTALECICYYWDIDLLHPSSCPTFVQFSEGIYSVHRKDREL